MHGETAIIAEVKTHSPFGYKSDKTWNDLFDIAEATGDIISVHTDPRWGGSLELIRRACARTTKEILAKGIHATDEEVEAALEAGAEHVLVVGRVPQKFANFCLIEPLSLAQLATVPRNLKAVWNSRDLSDGGLKTETFAQARELFDGWLCQASNIRTVDDIEEGADAVLVGTHLEEFARSLS